MRIDSVISKRATRLVVVGAAASMCFATAAPALAHETSSTSDPAKTTTAPTLEQQKAWLNSYITHSREKLAALASKVAADPKLTAEQKAAWAAKISDEETVLTQLRDAVAAASSTDEVHAAVKAAITASGVHGVLGWFRFFGGQHWSDQPARQLKAHPSAHKSAPRTPARHASDPGKTTLTTVHTSPTSVKQPDHGTSHSVVLRSAKSGSDRHSAGKRGAGGYHGGGYHGGGRSHGHGGQHR